MVTHPCQHQGISDLLKRMPPRLYSTRGPSVLAGAAAHDPKGCTVGGAGNVIFFVTMYALAAMSGVLLLIYTAYCFFVVVDDTIAGLDEVIWPGESIGDWLIRGAVLAWLVLV